MISPEFQNWLLAKKDLESFLKSLLDTHAVFGPVKTACGEEFLRVREPHALSLDYQNSHRSPKYLFFPQTETLFNFDSRRDAQQERERVAPPAVRSSILLGIRPCDAAAIACLDAVFKGEEYCDPYYAQKRDATVVIGLSCTHPVPTCFCTLVGSGPDSATGCDILLHDLPEQYFLQVVTQRGEGIIQQVGPLLRRPTLQDEQERDRAAEKARQAIDRVFELDGLVEKLDDFDAPWWHRVHDKCLGCGICTFFCPTCHCFDITDEGTDRHGRRIRTWDSCMFPSFTEHGSGHNPRPTQKERVRQRIMHKFNYAMKNNDRLFCVGCGRCISRCPVNLDIRYILAHILEAS